MKLVKSGGFTQEAIVILWKGEKYMPQSRQVGRWQVGERQVVEADGKWENTKECINREPLSCI